jgi:dTDP-4-amino-4,6-dideoxygalactose transaminase
MNGALPAVLGGNPSFPQGLPLGRPTIPDIPGITARLQRVLETGELTNGPIVPELEAAVAQRLGVAHVVAVSSCTTGLMLVYQGLGVRGRVVMPSMTFAASAHAVVWAGGTPDFADVDPYRVTLDPTHVAELALGAAAVSATHLYGAPAEIEALQRVADAAGIPLVFDAAHALGAQRRGRPIGGFGAAEVFSLSPTKVVTAGEGGLVATNDAGLAERVRLGRGYGNPGDYDCLFPGINARMSELHATVALATFGGLDAMIEHRNELALSMRLAMSGVPGVGFQQVDDADLSSYKDMTLLLDPPKFGLTSGQLQRALQAEGIDSRRYFYPPVHRQKAYEYLGSPRCLPVTDSLADRLLTSPMYSHMTHAEMQRVADAITMIHEHAEAVWLALDRRR